jgi:maltose 6'-phosphate phosphatase
MDKINLLSVKNIISRKNKRVQQTIRFFMLVENVSYNKEVAVVWSGEEGVWKTLAIQYHSMQDGQKEYWVGSLQFTLTKQSS